MEHDDLLTRVLGNIVTQCANETLVLVQLEAFSFLDPHPPMLFPDDRESLTRELDHLSTALGGPPGIIIVGEDEESPTYDTYAEAAIKECIYAYERTRKSVCRAHLYLIGSSMLMDSPECINWTMSDMPEKIIPTVREAFWEHAETSYIRLASYWDRIGQILDFAFFNIRQYERDGLAAVLNRIHSNFLHVCASLGSHSAWSRLRKYQNSEEPDGFNWLVRRRNLLIHSLHLQPIDDKSPEDEIFFSAYNHLYESVRKKLKPGKAANELKLLHTHLAIASQLFPDVVALSLLGAQHNRGL